MYNKAITYVLCINLYMLGTPFLKELKIPQQFVTYIPRSFCNFGIFIFYGMFIINLNN